MQRYHTLIWLLLAGLAASAPLFLHLPNPLSRPFYQAVHESAHVVVFFVVQIACFYLCRRGFPTWHKALWVLSGALTALVLGAAVELIQPFLQRSASWQDMLRNTLGIMCASALLGLLYLQGWRRLLSALTLIGGLAVTAKPIWIWGHSELAVRKQFPVLANGECTAVNRLIQPIRQAELSFPLTPTNLDPSNKVIQAIIPKDQRWPGISFRAPYSNWQGFTHLQVDLKNLSGTDERYSINFYSIINNKLAMAIETFTVAPGAQTVKVPLPLNKKFNPTAIVMFDWHGVSLDTPVTLQLDNLRLVKQVDQGTTSH